MSDDVSDCFRTIIEEREAQKIEKMVDGLDEIEFEMTIDHEGTGTSIILETER